MEYRKREFMMEPMRMSPVQPRQRQKSHKYSSTISPYNMDRTARIKARSSVAKQTNSFQDHMGETSELVHIDSFQEPSYMAAADSFQDHLEEFRKLVHIDSFQDHLEEFRKSVQIDSFQDHCPYGKSLFLLRPSQWPRQQIITN